MSTVMQVRLPDDAAEFVRRRATDGRTQSDVLREAVACLREKETQALMAEGYAKMSARNKAFAESTLASQRQVLTDT